MRIVLAILMCLAWVWQPPATGKPSVAAPRTSACAYENNCWPDATNTGYTHTGVTLTTYGGSCNITTPNTTIDSQTVNCTLTVTANNFTITRSKVNGTIALGHSAQTGAVITDVEINGSNTTAPCIGNNNFTALRVNAYRCGQGLWSYAFSLTDSYIHDLYGEGTVHSEAILSPYSNAGAPNVTIHNTLQANYGAEGTWNPSDGGMSTSVAMYTHAGVWESQSHQNFRQNKLSTGNTGRGHAVYCMYAGSDATAMFTLTATTIRDNVFVRNASTGECGDNPVNSQPNSTSGNCASNNRYEDNDPVGFAGFPACAEPSPAPATAFGRLLYQIPQPIKILAAWMGIGDRRLLLAPHVTLRERS